MTTLKTQARQDFDWAFGINRMSSQICGIGTPTDGATGWRNAASKLQLLVFSAAILVFLLVPQTSALLRVWGHIFLMADNLKLSLLFFVVEFELITLWYKNEGSTLIKAFLARRINSLECSKAIATMMGYIKTDWMRPKTDQERKVMLRYGKLSRILTIGGYASAVVTIASYHFPVVFGFTMRTMTNLTDIGDRPFALPTSYPFYAYNSPVYELVVFSQFVAGTIGGICYTTVGTLFGVIVLHVSAQLETLCCKIEGMGKMDEVNLQYEFKLTIEEHVRLIRFSAMIDNTFSLILLEVATGFTLIVCLQGYQIVLMYEDDAGLVAITYGVIFLIYVIFISFAYSAVGDTLVTQSERIQFATYNCEWYKLKPREAAQFIPILVRSHRPVNITVGKFASLTLPTFATLMKTTAGYISCLLAVRD